MEIMNLFTKESSVVSTFNFQQTMVSGNMFISDVSDFCANSGVEEKPLWYDKLAIFDQLVAVRKEYLDMLPSLGEDWISGNSFLPSQAVVEESKKLLDTFNNYLARKKRQNKIIDVPKLVMGPIPAGGIEIEFHVNNENALYVSIFNNNTIEIELKYFDYYFAIEPKDFHMGVIADYERLTSANRNSGWGDFIPILQSEGASRRPN